MPTPSWDTRDISSRKMAKHLEKLHFCIILIFSFSAIQLYLSTPKIMTWNRYPRILLINHCKCQSTVSTIGTICIFLLII